MLLLGVLQAQAAGQVAAGSFDLLETQVLASSAASVTFSGLSAYAADYQHLQIRYSAQSNRSSPNFNDLMSVQFNGDTAANYSAHYLRGYELTVQSGYNATIQWHNLSINYKGADIFAAGVIDILDPFDTNKYTTMRGFTGYINNASTFEHNVNLTSTSWRNTAAVNSILLDDEFGNSFTARSRFSLYGVKGSA